jgi:hypothetical protein
MRGINAFLGLRGGDPQAAAAILQAWQSWLSDKNSTDARDLMRNLGLPASRKRQLIALRDTYLRAAAEGIAPGAERYTQTILLLEAVKQFSKYQWPAWQRLNEAPTRASDSAHLLFAAFRAASHIDHGTAHLPDVLGKTAVFKLLRK